MGDSTTISTPDGDFVAYISRPVTAPAPAIVVIQEIFGVNQVMRDIADKETVMGFPAVPDRQAKRQWIAIQKLPEMMTRMRELEKQLAGLKGGGAP